MTSEKVSSGLFLVHHFSQLLQTVFYGHSIPTTLVPYGPSSIVSQIVVQFSVPEAGIQNRARFEFPTSGKLN